jgi:hypothetical protein
MTMIMNTGRVPLQVGIVQTSTGKKGSMRVMGRGRHALMAGYTLDPNWMALFGKSIKVVESTTVKPAVNQVAPTVTPTVTTKTTTPAPTVATNKGAT